MGGSRLCKTDVGSTVFQSYQGDGRIMIMKTDVGSTVFQSYQGDGRIKIM